MKSTFLSILRILMGTLVFVVMIPLIAIAEDAPSFLTLPDFVATPDGMAICPRTGDLVISCPNFGDPSKPGCLIRIDKDYQVRKWVDLPILEETGRVCPMGIDIDSDGAVYLCDNQDWAFGNGEKGEINHGRVLRLEIEGDQIEKVTTVAENIPQPNGLKLHGNFVYITVNSLPTFPLEDGQVASGVYRFPKTAENLKLTLTEDDPFLFAVLRTENSNCPYGADGLCFDDKGRLYVGNFGDGALWRTKGMANGSEPRQAEWEIFAQRAPLPPYSDPDFLAKASVIPLRTTDGMNFDFKRGVIYVADFANNAVAEVSTKDRSIRFFAQSPDNDGQNGELNQPGEACVWNGRLAVTCFDMLTTPDMVNRNHDPKATIVFLPLEQPDVKKH